MGYTGHIKINERTVLQEWKHTGTYYGQFYATAYLRQKGCDLTLDAIYEVIGNLYGSRYDEVGEADRQITYSNKLIDVLRDLVSNEYIWDKNQILQAETFIGEYDRVGLAKVVSGNLQTDKSYFLETEFFFKTAFGDEISGENNGKNFYETLVNTKQLSRLFILESLEKLCDMQNKCLEIYLPFKKKNTEFIKILQGLARDIENGDSLNIRFSSDTKNLLQIYSKMNKAIRNIFVEREYDYYDLFIKNNLYRLGAFCKITSKEELKILINSFEMVEKRDKNIEKVLIDFYNSILDNENFEISLSGSF